jgi:Cu(I)/Ag(I) efflux system periplasmic protein CusF
MMTFPAFFRPLVLIVGGLCVFGLASPAFAQTNPATAQAAVELAEGEVRKIDRDAKKVTLKHGDIKSLEMPPMTMVFQVKDMAMLEGMKVGDKVRFAAEQAKSGYVVTRIEAAK